jgi:hypothetical protein
MGGRNAVVQGRRRDPVVALPCVPVRSWRSKLACDSVKLMRGPRQARCSQLPQTCWPQGSQLEPTVLAGSVGHLQEASALVQFCWPGRASMASRKALIFSYWSGSVKPRARREQLASSARRRAAAARRRGGNGSTIETEETASSGPLTPDSCHWACCLLLKP